MSNKNYIKGRRKEYAIRSSLIKEGWDIVQRTAGSHSPIDVIAIHKFWKIIKCIQAKPDDYSNRRIETLYQKHGWLNDYFEVRFEVI